MPGTVDALLDVVTAQVAALPRETIRALAPVLQEARQEVQRDLRRWLRSVPNGAERFTAQHYRNVLVQLQGALDTIDKMEPKVVGTLTTASGVAGQAAVSHLKAELEVFGQVFQHTIRPIPFDTAGIIARGNRMLIPRFRSSAARYVGDVRTDIKRQLALGVVRGENIDQLKARLIRLGGPRGAVALRGVLGDPDAVVEFIGEGLFKRYNFWAERVARTEVIQAYNTHAHTGLEKFAADDDGALKRWDARLDRRVCLLCRELDGKTAAVDGYFPFGYKHPTAHPNCRCAVVAWHREWSEAEVYGERGNFQEGTTAVPMANRLV